MGTAAGAADDEPDGAEVIFDQNGSSEKSFEPTNGVTPVSRANKSEGGMLPVSFFLRITVIFFFLMVHWRDAAV